MDLIVQSGGYTGVVTADTYEKAFAIFLEQTDPEKLGLLVSFMSVDDPDPDNVCYGSTERYLKELNMWDTSK